MERSYGRMVAPDAPAHAGDRRRRLAVFPATTRACLGRAMIERPQRSPDNRTLPPAGAWPGVPARDPGFRRGKPPRNGRLNNRQQRKAMQGRARLLQICKSWRNTAFFDVLSGRGGVSPHSKTAVAGAPPKRRASRFGLTIREVSGKHHDIWSSAIPRAAFIAHALSETHPSQPPVKLQKMRRTCRPAWEDSRQATALSDRRTGLARGGGISIFAAFLPWVQIFHGWQCSPPKVFISIPVRYAFVDADSPPTEICRSCRCSCRLRYVRLPLETNYQSAFNALPNRWREVLED